MVEIAHNLLFFICFKISSAIMTWRSKFPQEISTKCFIKSYKIITFDEWNWNRNWVDLIGMFDMFELAGTVLSSVFHSFCAIQAKKWRMNAVQHLTVHQIDLIQSGGNNYNNNKREENTYLWVYSQSQMHTYTCMQQDELKWS